MQAVLALLSSLPSSPAPTGCWRRQVPGALTYPTFGQRFFCAFGSSSSSCCTVSLNSPRQNVNTHATHMHAFATLPRQSVSIFWRETPMKTSIYSLLLALALSGVSVAQVSTAPAAIQLNTIYAGADGKFEAAPDTAVIRMDIASQQDTSRAAYDHTALAVDHVRQVLKSNGIDLKAAQFGTYQMQPMYDWKNPKHKVIGYRVASDVTLKLRDFTKIGALTEQLADIEDTRNQSVNYTLEDIEQAK